MDNILVATFPKPITPLLVALQPVILNTGFSQYLLTISERMNHMSSRHHTKESKYGLVTRNKDLATKFWNNSQPETGVNPQSSIKSSLSSKGPCNILPPGIRET
jgi:hypothetical protein